jgi:hypothetical protein
LTYALLMDVDRRPAVAPVLATNTGARHEHPCPILTCGPGRHTDTLQASTTINS